VNQPPIVVSQHCTPSVPASSDLEEAVLWNYGFAFYGGGSTAFEVKYNEEETIAYSMDLEDVDGTAQVRVTAASGALPVVRFEGTTLEQTEEGSRYRNADGSLLTFEDAAYFRQRNVVIERLDALDVQSARATVQQVTFGQPLLPLVEVTQPIAIGGHAADVGNRPATIAAHLTALLQTLLGNSPFASQPASIECRYGYSIGGLPIEAPVLLVTRQDLTIAFDDQLIEQIADAIQQWLDAVQPPATDARLLFSLTFWSALPQTDAMLLRLTSLSLPMSDVVPAPKAAVSD
jgi:hypothetical protein